MLTSHFRLIHLQFHSCIHQTLMGILLLSKMSHFPRTWLHTSLYIASQWKVLLIGRLDLGLQPVTNGLFSTAYQAETNIETLLSNLGPNTPLSNEDLAIPSQALNGFSGFNPANGLIAPPPPPPANTCTSLYVKNLPPETDRLWLYER